MLPPKPNQTQLFSSPPFYKIATISENAVVSRSVRIDSIFPPEGTATGGTHLHVRGDGFSVDTYGGSNAVGIGGDSLDYLAAKVLASDARTYGVEFTGAWATCQVIEGACTVDCEFGIFWSFGFVFIRTNHF